MRKTILPEQSKDSDLAAADLPWIDLDRRASIEVTSEDPAYPVEHALGIVLAFLVPSTTARVACIVPIIMGIILAFGVDQRSRFAGLLMITTAQAASIWNVGIKTAAAQNMVAIGFMEKTLKGTVTYPEWLLAAAPWAILMSIALYFVMMKLMPPEMEDRDGEPGSIVRLRRKAVLVWRCQG